MLKEKTEEGFTLIELIIVVVILALLAGIAISVYSGTRGDAKTIAAQTDLRNTSHQLEMFYAENNRYPTALPRELAGVIVASKPIYEGTSTSGTNFLYCSDGENYLIYAISENGERVQQSSQYGMTMRRTSSNNAIACPAFGVSDPYRMLWLNDGGNWNNVVR